MQMEVIPVEIQKYICEFIDIYDIYKWKLHKHHHSNIFRSIISHYIRRFLSFDLSLFQTDWVLYDKLMLRKYQSFKSYLFSLFEKRETKPPILFLISNINDKKYLLYHYSKDHVLFIEPKSHGFYIQSFFQRPHSSSNCDVYQGNYNESDEPFLTIKNNMSRLYK